MVNCLIYWFNQKLVVEQGNQSDEEGGRYFSDGKTASNEVEIAQVWLAHDARICFLVMKLVHVRVCVKFIAIFW